MDLQLLSDKIQKDLSSEFGNDIYVCPAKGEDKEDFNMLFVVFYNKRDMEFYQSSKYDAYFDFAIGKSDENPDKFVVWEMHTHAGVRMRSDGSGEPPDCEPNVVDGEFSMLWQAVVKIASIIYGHKIEVMKENLLWFKPENVMKEEGEEIY